MKKLYLIRHAKSSWENSALADFNRPLNKRGKRDAPFIGKILSEKNTLPEIVYSSPAKRALITAKEICNKINFPVEKIRKEESIYEASSNVLLQIIQSTDEDYKSVMLFGHNPSLTSLQNYICEKKIDNIPTCGVVCIEIKKTWKELNEERAKLIFFEYPKLYYKT
jgi:phosphohistidine phosphatase